jgi:hypothetical protein
MGPDHVGIQIRVLQHSANRPDHFAIERQQGCLVPNSAWAPPLVGQHRQEVHLFLAPRLTRVRKQRDFTNTRTHCTSARCIEYSGRDEFPYGAYLVTVQGALQKRRRA